jgi:hypothetical protein
MTPPSKFAWLAPSVALSLAIVAGCDQPGGPKRTPNRTGQMVGVDMPQDDPVSAPAPAPAPPPAPFKTKPILNQTTQEISDPEKAKQAGAAPAPRQLSKDPFRVYGNAYTSILGQASISQITQAVEFYRANNDGQYPKTQEEFMENVIKPNNIRLPVLPRNRKYVYDVDKHELGIWEYPEGQ